MNLLVLPGDGIGPEIVASTVTVLDAVGPRHGLDFRYTTREIGFGALKKSGTTLPSDILDIARSMDGTLLGPISHMDYPPREQGGINVSAAFRKHLDLFANIRPARTREGVFHRGTDMDLVIMRENTEGMYPDRNMYAGIGEFMPTEDVAISMRKVTAKAIERIAKASFELARDRRGKVTAVHKANAFVLTDGLFLKEVRKVAAAYPDVTLEEVLIDAMAALLVRDASRYDVICTTNFYGDTLSDLASELSGSLGLAGSLNAGLNHAAAQAQHGSAPDIAGMDKANPTSMILSAAMLLRWHGERTEIAGYIHGALAIETAVDRVLGDVSHCTGDLGGPLGTRQFTETLVAALD
ncbi:isocitrate/isopropylmalate dehydrogenase family protein [Pseudorhizobium pelagicum]|uniref:3-isopropylmalate dehydrogenase n=1 Tax=Pseudorhizobium pelagicum TaxID=1509405 RepID=A0A922P0F5_9HYPH|nr:isocitrate/isopropylmalate dehydrogenase family protein [Pseudorhizobium pelagicum]KEQ08294.1 3-isopropylmalate dehydrogenase [Pseudorhizobium pelagicum]KEQ09135.1 3-isopropylmalate dehydrogenase [Pseudorhizobium pelagicum]